jgi:hypothetical protein
VPALSFSARGQNWAAIYLVNNLFLTGTHPDIIILPTTLLPAFLLK